MSSGAPSSDEFEIDPLDRTVTNTPVGGLPKDGDEKALNREVAPQQLFAEPGTIPLLDAGFHSVGVAFDDLTVLGTGATRATVEGLEISLLRMWDIFRFIRKLANIKWGPTRPIISNFDGVVPAGETMLVLGRPGAGCSTLLRALANERAPFARIDGNVQYSNISADEAYKYYRGDIVFNNEEDIHTAILTVEQTLDTALTLKKPRSLDQPVHRKTFVEDLTTRLLNAFGMPHTRRTKVGNEFMRGVSGGERKRVSLSEMLTTNGALICWDNSIRGLDSAVALHYLKLLKELSLSTGMTNIVSIYQASDEMYATCFDRVLVIYEGEMVFSGRAEDAEPFFIEQGWHKKPRQTTPDFLTSVTSPTERTVRPDHNGPVPHTPAEMAAYFRSSRYYAKLQGEIKTYKDFHATAPNADSFRQSVAASKHLLTGRGNPYKHNFFSQVWALTKRQVKLTKADLPTFFIRIGSNALQATIVGAIFFKPAANASGSFATAGAVFFAILYFVIFSFGEVPTTVNARPLLIKHRKLGFYTPAAQTISQMLIDTPLYALQTLLFSAIFYFLIGLNAGAKYFFTFWFIVFTTYMTVSVMYRMIGSWSPNLSVAVRFGGLALATILTVAGFMLPEPSQLGWASWMRRFSPAAYALETLLANEFRTRTLTCSDTDLVPSGPGYGDLAYQACTITGGQPGQRDVPGSTYLDLKYGYLVGNIWRNVGILWAMFVIYAFMVVLGSTIIIKDTGSSSSKLFKRGAQVVAVEKQSEKTDVNKQAEEAVDEEAEKRLVNASAFTFKEVRYTVQVDGKDKVLLDGVNGIVQPGKLTALMGASGAGKTTLLDTISQRKTTGKVEGQILVDGAPLDATFGRRTGFVQQGDIHEPFSTVRECLQFSAILRQDKSIPREEKLAYAEQVIELLELQPIADAVVGNAEVGGLGVEERKRLTIGVELAAKPDFLLFLDEPTSGLDSQAAYEIVRFLRKIAASGLAVLCTIHQPSGDLFEMFDAVVLLAPGGKTVYAGPTGTNAETVNSYFARHGAPAAPNANPAEHIISTVAPVGGTTIDWPGLWKQSPEASALLTSIESISARSHNSAAAASEGAGDAPAFAMPFSAQTMELVRRNFRAQWRDGPYYTTKLVTGVFFGMFIGFFNYKLTPTVVGVQALSLGLLTLAQSSPPLMLDIAFYYQHKMDIFVARERNGIYGWPALVTALLIVELPIIIITYTLLFFCSYWTMGLSSGAQVGGLSWLTWMVFAFFTSTSGTLLGAVSPTGFAVPFILSLIWNIYNSLSGALVPHPTMVQPFKSFFYWISPIRWAFGALMSDQIAPLAVRCADDELTRFNTPANRTCADYAAAFLAKAPGYLVNPDARSNCGYCQMSSGADYMSVLGYSYDHRWRDWGIFIMFVVSNVAAIYAVTWLVRIRPLYK